MAGMTSKLPNLPTAFTGREMEVQTILNYVSVDRVKVVAITGGPGYGKSSLAIVCAYNLSVRYSDVQAYHISLTEVDTIDSFVMKTLVSFDGIDESDSKQLSNKEKLLSHLRTLKRRTVLLLDNVDHLTLGGKRIRFEFMKIIKEMIHSSAFIQLLVTTRYRFKLVDDFEEVHLQPLSNRSTVSLLQKLLLPTGLFSGKDAEQLPVIANLTGGIPLAVKVLSQLLKSQTLSVTEVIEGLVSHPMHTLSRDSFSPDEQLNRCFNLSYTYLSPVSQLCFIYASRFPAPFDKKAVYSTISVLTNDSHSDCMTQLTERSLVEYNTHSGRYDVHSLLRYFVMESVASRFQWKEFLVLYVEHYINLMLTLIKNVTVNGCKEDLYSSIAMDYYHYLEAFKIITNSRISVIPPDLQLYFMAESFHIVQVKFPWEIQIRLWQRILYDSCYNDVNLSLLNVTSKVNEFATAVMKLVSLLQYRYGDVASAKQILYFAVHCIKLKNFVLFPLTMDGALCGARHLSSFFSLLSLLKMMLNDDEQVAEIEEYIKLCLGSSHSYEAESEAKCNPLEFLQEKDHCTQGIEYLRHIHASGFSRQKSVHYVSSEKFIHLVKKCSGVAAAIEEMQKIEEHVLSTLSTDDDRFRFGLSMIRLSKLWEDLHNATNQVRCLLKATHALHEESFSVHFLLSRLYFTELNNDTEAKKHALIAYKIAHEKECYHCIFKAAFRLADILFEMYNMSDAFDYYQEALDWLPLLNCKESFRYKLYRYIQGHIIDLSIRLQKFDSLALYSGQWTKIEIVDTAYSLKFLLEIVLSMPFNSSHRHDVSVMGSDILMMKFGGIDFTTKLYNTYFIEPLFHFRTVLLLVKLLFLFFFVLALICCNCMCATFNLYFCFCCILSCHYRICYICLSKSVSSFSMQLYERAPRFVGLCLLSRFCCKVFRICSSCAKVLFFFVIYCSIIAVTKQVYFSNTYEFHNLSMTLLDTLDSFYD